MALGFRSPSSSSPAWSLGAAIGAAQGYFIAYLKIPAFIVTLAGMLVFRGLALYDPGRHVGRPLPGRVPAA